MLHARYSMSVRGKAAWCLTSLLMNPQYQEIVCGELLGLQLLVDLVSTIVLLEKERKEREEEKKQSEEGASNGEREGSGVSGSPLTVHTVAVQHALRYAMSFYYIIFNLSSSSQLLYCLITSKGLSVSSFYLPIDNINFEMIDTRRILQDINSRLFLYIHTYMYI